MTSRTASRLQLLAAAALFSTGGAAIKATDLGAWQVASFRSGIAAVALLCLVKESRRGWTWQLLPPAMAYAATLVLFVQATKLTTAANAIFLQSSAPLYLLVLGPWLLRERVRRADLALPLVVAVGMALFFVGRESPVETAPDPTRGNVLGVVSGLTWALTLTGLRWQGRRAGGSGAAVVVAGNAIAFLVCLGPALPVEGAGWSDLLVLSYLGVFQIGLAYVFVTRALGHVPAFEAATLLLLEPVLNPVWAWLVHGEQVGALALTGGAVILTATLLNTWRQRRTSVNAAVGSSAGGNGRR
jgi:drug/metabolite transporter (DMT)-like permease